MQTYAGMVDAMDTNIGRLLAHLEATGQAENTLVLFLSDKGADPNLLPEQPAFRPWYEENYPFTYMEDYAGNYGPMGLKGSYSDYGAGWAAAANTPRCRTFHPRAPAAGSSTTCWPTPPRCTIWSRRARSSPRSSRRRTAPT